MNKALEAFKKITVGGIAAFFIIYSFAITLSLLYFISDDETEMCANPSARSQEEQDIIKNLRLCPQPE